LPPLTIELSTLQKGCSIIQEAFLTAKMLFTNYPNSNFYQEKDDDCKSRHITLPEDLFSEKIYWLNKLSELPETNLIWIM